MNLKEAKKRIEELEARIATLEKGVQIHINHYHHQVQPLSPEPYFHNPFPATCASSGTPLKEPIINGEIDRWDYLEVAS